MEFLKNFLAKFKVKNKSAFRHGTYSAVIIAVVIVGVIVLNMLMGVLSERGVLSFDITTTKENTLDAENKEYIKTVDKEVTITVLSNEDTYASMLANYAEQYFHIVDESGYYLQTVKILKQYEQLNKKIDVVFENFYSNKTESLFADYPSLFYGDILVECDGKQRLLTFEDIYTYSDAYANYFVDGNNVETAVSSAINALTSGESKNLAILSSHSTADVFTKFYSDTLKSNNFAISEINEAILQKIPADIDVLVIAAPTKDLLESEVTVINEWLSGDAKRGKSLIFIPGSSLAKMPVLKQFLAEWGIKYTDGILYQTDSNFSYSGDATDMLMFMSNTDITKKIAPQTNSYSFVGSNLAMLPAYETYASRKTYTVVSTNDTVTVAPEGFSSDWKPSSSAQKGVYAGLIITEEENIVDNERYTSCVAAFSTQEFVYSSWAADSKAHNMAIAVNTARYMSGLDTNQKVFLPKTIETDNFSTEISNSEIKTVKALFTIVLPILIAGAGVFVWIRRKRR